MQSSRIHFTGVRVGLRRRPEGLEDACRGGTGGRGRMDRAGLQRRRSRLRRYGMLIHDDSSGPALRTVADSSTIPKNHDAMVVGARAVLPATPDLSRDAP